MNTNQSHKLVDLKSIQRNPASRLLVSLLEKPIEKTLALDVINKLYSKAEFNTTSDNNFYACLQTLQANYRISQSDMAAISRHGPVTVVSNHPFGGIEGIIIGHIMTSVRSDVKILANYILTYIPELKDYIIPVNPFSDNSAKLSNAMAFREAIRWLNDGHMLVTFPAGTVSHLNLKYRMVTDPEWSKHIGSIIRRTKSSVLPVYFPGHNGSFFQLMGLIHPMLRTVLLPHELVNKTQKTFDVFVGKSMPFERLTSYDSDQKLINHIRKSAYFLKSRELARSEPKATTITEQLINAVPKSHIKQEIAALNNEDLLLENGEYSVYAAQADRIPKILREIGRLREKTFRAVAEGTGFALDLDHFDNYYYHLFLWDKLNEKIVGAYRLGLGNQIIAEHDVSGFYTHTLFLFKKGIKPYLEKSVELGRSFICEEYQKQYNCLAMLWRGIGEFIVRRPNSYILFGPVSISQDYHVISKHLMIQFLKQNNFDHQLADHVKARNPYKNRLKKSLAQMFQIDSFKKIEDISFLISEIEQDGKGVPILLRQYLKLNARLLSFNVDADFSDVVDGLIMVDLRYTPEKLLKRFMGSGGYQDFLNKHLPQESKLSA